MKSLGVGWVRYDVEWSQVETKKGQFDWSKYDHIVQTVQSYDLQSLIVIDYTPSWARPPGCDSDKCAPANPADYASFTAAVASRYQTTGVSSWEIWNEPNNSQFFQPQTNTTTYTALLKAAYQAIKHVQPQSTVITAGLSPASTNGRDISPIDFVNGMYNAGAKGYFDALAHHPYSFPFTTANVLPGSAWSQLASMHAAMVAHGDGNKSIWITEYGAPTGGPGGHADIGAWPLSGGTPVTEALQSAMITSVGTSLAGLPWVQHFFYYSLKDAGTSSDTVENFFGLLRANNSAKPAFGTYQQTITSWH
jgi:hypothetical protein